MITVTLHALSRWRERAPDTLANGPDAVLSERIAHSLMRSRPVRLKSARERISKTLRHGDRAQYRHHGAVVLVIVLRAVVSVYAYDGDRWEGVTIGSRAHDCNG